MLYLVRKYNDVEMEQSNQKSRYNDKSHYNDWFGANRALSKIQDFAVQ